MNKKLIMNIWKELESVTIYVLGTHLVLRSSTIFLMKKIVSSVLLSFIIDYHGIKKTFISLDNTITTSRRANTIYVQVVFLIFNCVTIYIL